jgi:hypothetical protein
MIAEKAAGNPFFAEEIVRDLAERGVLWGNRSAYESTADVAEVSVPATLQATIAARIDRDNSPRAIARSRIWAALIRRGSRQTPRRACRPRRLRTPPLDPRRPTRLLRAIPASTSVIRLLHAVGVVMASGSAAEDTTAKGH